MSALLGALAGLGKGMTDYAGILGEKRKNDWASEAANVKHQRETELEMLRSRNTLERDKSLSTLKREEADYQAGVDVNKAGALAKAELQFKGSPEYRELQQKGLDMAFADFLRKNQVELDTKYAELSETQKNAMILADFQSNLRLQENRSTLAMESEQKITDVEKIAAVQNNIGWNAKNDQLNRFKQSGEWESLSEEGKRTMEMLYLFPEVYGLISDPKESSEVQVQKMKMFHEGYQEGLASYEALPARDKKKFDSVKAKEPSLRDMPSNVAYAYFTAGNAANVAASITKGSSKSRYFKKTEEPSAPTGRKIQAMAEDVKAQTVEELKSGEADPAEVEASVSKSLWQELKARWEEPPSAMTTANKPPEPPKPAPRGFGTGLGIVQPQREAAIKAKEEASKKFEATVAGVKAEIVAEMRAAGKKTMPGDRELTRLAKKRIANKG